MPEAQKPRSRDEVAETGRAWVIHLASGAADEQDLAALRAWLAADPRHRAAFEDARRLWQAVAPLPDAFAPPAATTTQTSRVRPAGVRSRRRLGRAGAVAAFAAALVLFVLGGGRDAWVQLHADYATAVGAQARVTLPDGSRAYLNTDTAIAVRYDEGTRSVDLLKGEAFFDVRENAARPFRVRVNDVTATALGTAYAVRDAGARSTVSVAEGRVAVRGTGEGQDDVVLRAGERLVHAGDGHAPDIETVDPGRTAAWRAGRIVIDGVSLTRAVATLDRYRPGKILILGNSAEERPVSGVFRTDRITSAVKALAATHGLHVTRITNRLLILH